jgi:hypothetical protein
LYVSFAEAALGTKKNPTVGGKVKITVDQELNPEKS